MDVPVIAFRNGSVSPSEIKLKPPSSEKLEIEATTEIALPLMQRSQAVGVGQRRRVCRQHLVLGGGARDRHGPVCGVLAIYQYLDKMRFGRSNIIGL